MDIQLSPDHDLTSPKLQSELLSQTDLVDAVVIALDCSTLTRVRDKPIPGHPNSPPPLRSEKQPFGLENINMAKNDVKRIEDTNRLIEFFVKLMEQVIYFGCATIVENPEGSYLSIILDALQQDCSRVNLTGIYELYITAS